MKRFFLALALVAPSYVHALEVAEPSATIAMDNFVTEENELALSSCHVEIECPIEGKVSCDATGHRTFCDKGNDWISCKGITFGRVAESSYTCRR